MAVVRPAPPLFEDERGQAVLETALVFPVVVLVLLGFYQVVLLAHIHGSVRLAAFHGARSASVWLPHDAAGEPPGTAVLSSGNLKQERILGAARLATVAVSPRLSAVGDRLPAGAVSAGEELRAEVSGALSGLGDALPAEDYADQYGYAAIATAVAIQGQTAGGGGEVALEPFEDVCVTVTHEAFLAVPYASAVFAGLDRSATLAGVEGEAEIYTATVEARTCLPLESAHRLEETAP